MGGAVTSAAACRILCCVLLRTLREDDASIEHVGENSEQLAQNALDLQQFWLGERPVGRFATCNGGSGTMAPGRGSVQIHCDTFPTNSCSVSTSPSISWIPMVCRYMLHRGVNLTLLM